MLILVATWVIGGALWVAGIRYLLHVKQAQYDHTERMVELAAARALQDEEIERGRIERAGRTRPDLAEMLAEAGVLRETLTDAIADAPTEVMVAIPPTDLPGPAADDQELPAADPAGLVAADEWPSELDAEVADTGKHRLPTPL